ncbi:MAG TPA: BON domain-containing protein [Longimicrobium sp.]|nr:BON domain-containing protein [Longimicrobium sp.]
MRRLRDATVVALAALAGACSFLHKELKETPAQVAAVQAEDTRIAREVEARLAAEPTIGAGRVRVEVQRGEVGLFGAVSGLGALRCAERNAELVRGVRLVIDQLVLDPGPRDARCLAPRVFGAARPGT